MKLLPQFELQFKAVDKSERDLTFPCDENGRVELDGLTERGRLEYLFARAMVRRHYTVEVCRRYSLSVEAPT